MRLATVITEEGKEELALQMIERGARLDTLSDGNTPLMYATQMRKHGIMDALIAAGANVNVKGLDEPGEVNTALMTAADNGDLWAVKRLLQAGADVGAATRRKETALYWGAARGNVEVVRELVSAGSPIHHNEMHLPVFKRDLTMVKLMLGAGCDPNSAFFHTEEDLVKGDTPLLVAVRQTPYELLDLKPSTHARRLAITKLLLKKGAEPNVLNAHGRSPLIEAVLQRSLGYARLLLAAGADPGLHRAGKTSPRAIAEKLRLGRFLELFRPKRK
jgi:ankyrin repeat protein